MAFDPRPLVKDQHNQLLARTENFKLFGIRYTPTNKRYVLCRYSGKLLLYEGLFMSDADLKELAHLLYVGRAEIDKRGNTNGKQEKPKRS